MRFEGNGLGQPAERSGYWSQLLPSIPDGQNYLWLTPEGGGDPVFGYRTRFWSFLLKLAPDLPAWTLPANPGPATGPFHWDNRPLTVQEMLRLQSFPRSWRVTGSERDQIRQAGNATPPLLAEVVGRAIGEQVFGIVAHAPPRFRISRCRDMRARRRKLAPIPKEFRKYIRQHRPHPGTGKGPSPILRKTEAQ